MQSRQFAVRLKRLLIELRNFHVSNLTWKLWIRKLELATSFWHCCSLKFCKSDPWKTTKSQGNFRQKNQRSFYRFTNYELIWFISLFSRIARMSSHQKNAQPSACFWRHAQAASFYLLIRIIWIPSFENSNMPISGGKPRREIFRQIAWTELMYEQFTCCRLNRWILILTPWTPFVRQQVFLLEAGLIPVLNHAFLALQLIGLLYIRSSDDCHADFINLFNLTLLALYRN